MARFRKCPRCKASVAVEYDYVDGQRVPTCMNCGQALRVTKPRGMTWDYVTKDAATDRGMSIKNRLAFHYFNPNGLLHAKHALDEQISALVDAKIVKSGWIVAYGTFDGYYEARVRELHLQKRPNRFAVSAVLSMLAERNDKVRQKIAEAKDQAHAAV